MSLPLEKLSDLTPRHTIDIERPWFSPEPNRQVALETLAEYFGNNSPVAQALQDHIANPTAAHAASAISTPATGSLPAGNVAGQLAALAKTVSVRTFVLSQILGDFGDADLENASNGATVRDDTSAIQSILDEASATVSVQLIVDGRYGVTGLSYGSNTTIRGMPGCGFLLRNNSDAPALANRTLTPGGGSAAQRDKNIIIADLILHCNRNNQVLASAEQGWIIGLRAAGVENMVLQNVTVRSTRTFAAQFSNWKNLRVVGCRVENPNVANTDGFKFNGPGQNLFFADFHHVGHDDAFSICPNEVSQQISPAIPYPSYGPFAAGGDISDVVVDGVIFGGGYGFRILTTTNRIDRVRIANLTGAVNSHIGIIDNYSEQLSVGSPVGWGEVGDVVIDGVNVIRTGTAYKNAGFFISGRVRRVSISNVVRPYAIQDTAFIRATRAIMDVLELDGYASLDTPARPTGSHIRISSGHIGKLHVSRVRVESFGPAVNAALVDQVEGGGINEIEYSDISVRGLRYVHYIGVGVARSLVANNITHSGHGGYAAFANAGGVNLIRSHVGSFAGGTLFSETSGTFGTKTGDGAGVPGPAALPATRGLLLARWASPNGTAIASHVPLVGPAFAATSGTWEIQNGKAVPFGAIPASLRFVAVADIGVNDNLIVTTQVRAALASGLAGIVFRYTDTGNYCLAVASASFGLQVYRVAAGVATLQGVATSLAGSPWASGIPFLIRIEVRGTTLVAYVGGIGAAITVTLSAADTGTQVGMVLANTTAGNFAEFMEFSAQSSA